MNQSQISVRYAKALFQIASEKQLLDEVFRDMQILTITYGIPEFQNLLVQPFLKASQKCNMVESVLKNRVTRISLSLIELVIKNKREIYLPGMARNFQDLYRKARGIRSATLITAHPVEEKEVSMIRELIGKTFPGEVELTEKLDEEIIGGFVLTIEDMQYDASVARNLRDMKNQLVQTSIEK